MAFPALDAVGFQRRSVLPTEYVNDVELRAAGFFVQREQAWRSRVYAQLRKRYGRGTRADSLPFGASPSPLVATGTAPPQIILSGVPSLGCIELQIKVTTPGPVGTAVFQWSSDNGVTWTTSVSTAASVVLGTTGITAAFGAGTYSADNLYVAETPVPSTILGWLVALLNVDILRKRGVNADDPQMALLVQEKADALAEVAQAANSQDGLFDLPTNDDGATSAVTTGGVLSYSESSPFVSADRQEFEGRLEDERGFGSFGGS